MIRTIVSIFITFALIAALSVYELYYVHTTFDHFIMMLDALHTKTQLRTVTDEDGDGVRSFWEQEKKRMHIWLPHTILMEIDYQLEEAIGYLYLKDYESALPKIQVVMGIAEDIPQSYVLHLENIL